MRSRIVYVLRTKYEIASVIILAVTSTMRIGGALLVGTLIILGALTVKQNSRAEEQGTIVADENTGAAYIATKDTDEDGTPDWEENLQEIFVEKAQLSSSTLAAYRGGDSYEPPTTLTGKFSEAFLKDYLDGKMKGEDFSDPTAFVETAVTAIESNTQSVTYTRRDITIVPAPMESVRAYGNRLAEINISNAINNENEALILQRALQANDPKILEDLAPIRTVYETMIAEALLMEVPDELADEHVAILNAYAAILLDVKAMQLAFDDPLLALARIKVYEEDARTLLTVFQALNGALDAYGVTFTTDEPGSFFYLFDA